MEQNFTVEFTGICLEWYESLTETWQDEIDVVTYLLEHYGPAIPRAYSKPAEGSTYSHMLELRIQCQGHPIRILYAFDPKRTAILLIGGDKTGDGRWYKKNIPKADELYKQHLASLQPIKSRKDGKENRRDPGKNVPGKKRKKQASS